MNAFYHAKRMDKQKKKGGIFLCMKKLLALSTCFYKAKKVV